MTELFVVILLCKETAIFGFAKWSWVDVEHIKRSKPIAGCHLLDAVKHPLSGSDDWAIEMVMLEEKGRFK